MAAMNVLKAAVEVIAESDNEIGGTLITRLTEAHIFGQNDAFISIAAVTNRIESLVDVWLPGHVGLEVDVIQKAAPTGNQGRYLISAVEGPRSIRVTTLLGGAVVFVAEDPVIWRLGTLRVETTFEFLNPPGTTDPLGQLWVGEEPEVVTYAARTLAPGANSFDQLGDYTTGAGYLTANRREDTEVVDALRIYSDLDKLRRAMLVAHAEGDELDRIGRNCGLGRPWGFTDAAYRRLLQVVPYAPRGTVYGLELLLAALYPTATPVEIRAMIYEDREQHHNTVYLLLPDVAAGLISEGRTFLNPGNRIGGITPGRDGGEVRTSATALTFATSEPAISIWKVQLLPVDQTLECLVLPSVDSPAWAYVNEGAAEGATFSIMAGMGLLQGPMVASNLGGRYRRNTIIEIGFDWMIEGYWKWTGTITAGRPWHFLVHDGTRSIAMFWDETSVELHDLGGSISTAAFAFGYDRWHHIRLRRKSGDASGVRPWENVVTIEIDGQVVLSAGANEFTVSATQDAGFGYMDLGAGAQSWAALWKDVHLYSVSARNYWNLSRGDGSLTAPTDVLSSASALFLAADGDVPKFLRLRGVNHRNTGLWRVLHSAVGTLTLEGIPYAGDASVEGKNGDLPDAPARRGGYNGALIRTKEARFVYEDGPIQPDGTEGKSIIITGSTLGNDGVYPILEVLDPWTVRVSYAAPGFVDEAGLTWAFDTLFVTEATVPWELINTGTVAGMAHTLRDALPAAVEPIEICYTDVLSALLLENEFVVNAGSGGTDPMDGIHPADIFYPFYLLDVSDPIRQLIKDLTVAGVIPEFRRGY